MISYFLNNRNYLQLLLIHFGLGIVIAIVPVVSILWLYTVLATEAVTLLRPQNNHLNFTAVIVYVSSLEIIGRMTKSAPFIPFEFGKYFMMGIFLLGMIHYGTKGTIGILMVSLLIPAFLIDESGESDFQRLVFNGLGVINIGLGVAYFYKRKVMEYEFDALLRIALYPLVIALAYTFYKTPDFDEIQFSYTMAKGTTGGFGPNQMSTILGLGALITYIIWIGKIKLTGYRMVDLGLLGLFMLQCILSFSRGGVLGAVLGILLLSFLLSLSSNNKRISKLSVFPKLMIGAVLGILAFLFINQISNNKLMNRYKGETESSLAGQKEVTVNSYTSNRYDIFFADIMLWSEYPILGTGVGASQTLRNFEVEETAAHVELSRLLAEHGLLGLIFFILLCWVGYSTYQYNKIPLYKAIMVTLFMIALYTTFHAALRTYVSPLFLTLSLLSVQHNMQTNKKQYTTSIQNLKGYG